MCMPGSTERHTPRKVSLDCVCDRATGAGGFSLREPPAVTQRGTRAAGLPGWPSCASPRHLGGPVGGTVRPGCQGPATAPVTQDLSRGLCRLKTFPRPVPAFSTGPVLTFSAWTPLAWFLLSSCPCFLVNFFPLYLLIIFGLHLAHSPFSSHLRTPFVDLIVRRLRCLIPKHS